MRHVLFLTSRSKPFSVILLLKATDTHSQADLMYFALPMICEYYTVSRLITNAEFDLQKQSL